MSMVSRWAAALAVLAAVAGCDSKEYTREEADQLCHPSLVTTAPDGTRLWRVHQHCPRVGSHSVYFSTSGTSTRVQVGKVTRDERVPNE